MYIKRERLQMMGIPFELYSFSALDVYFDVKDPSLPVLAVTNMDPGEIARHIDLLSFPGVEGVDAEARIDGDTILFSCEDTAFETEKIIPVLDFRYVPGRRVFRDPSGVYYLLRERATGMVDPGLSQPGWAETASLAVLASRYGFILPDEHGLSPGGQVLPVYLQRLYLAYILTGRNPSAGLSFLKKTGFIDLHWPELAALDTVDHGKEYHPEGNVWQHTLETFSYRKTRDLVLSLALLLHDLGKVTAVENEGNRFDRHAQIGGGMAAGFLRKLGFEQASIDEVYFLVSHHMLPAMVARLPVFRTEDTMNHRLFPLLLEVYRCDISSTFRGPEGYYEACRVYREFLKNRKNPYRTTAGKKMFRTYVE